MREEDTIVEEKEVIMVPPHSGGLPTLRNAHFITPIFNPKIQPLPKLPYICSASSKSNITKDKIVFRGMQDSQSSWKKWVEDLQKTHHLTWEKVGIFHAIRGSTYSIKKNSDLVIMLAEKWCSETNTFMFSWGEATITLEDDMIMGGFSVLGTCVENLPKLAVVHEFQKILNDACVKIKRDTKMSQVSHSAWMKYFRGIGGELEHVALIVLWLSRYVFPSSNVYSIAVNLVRGTRIALAPAVLASLYRDLSLLKEKIESSKCKKGHNDGSKLVLWAPLHLVQVWAWERFPTLRPIPRPLRNGEPRLARWHGVNRLITGNLMVEIESAGVEFLWRPYALSVTNWEFPKFYCDQGFWMLLDSEVDEELLSFARCLRVCELVGLNCVEQYLPHRVAMQFGMDQDIPMCVAKSNANVELAWYMYDKPLDGLKLYIPPRLLESDVTVQYLEWWRSQWSVHIEVPVSVKKQRTGVKKLKRMSHILNEIEEENYKDVPLCSSSPCNEIVKLDCFGNVSFSENSKAVQDIVIDLLLGLEDLNEGNEPKAVEEEKDKEVNNTKIIMDNTSSRSEVPLCSSSQRIEVMNIDVVGNDNDVSGNKLVPGESIKPQIVEREVTQIGTIELLYSMIRLEDEEDFEHSAMKVDEKNGVNESCKDMAEGGKHSESTSSLDERLIKDNGLSGEGPLIDAEMNALGGEQVEDVHDMAEENVNTKQMKTSGVDIVILSDEEDTSDWNPFESLFNTFETRMKELDKMASDLKGKIAKSKGRLKL